MQRIYHSKPPVGVKPNPMHPLSRGLVGMWLMNEGSGSKVLDVSGEGNDGTFTNMGASAWVGSPRGGALDFDGSDDYVDLGNSDPFNGLTEMSVCAWIRHDGTVSQDAGIIGSWTQSGDSAGFMFWVDNEEPASGRTNTVSFMANVHSAGRAIGSTNLVSDGVWGFYCGVFRASTYIRLYKNGVLDVENTTSVPSAVQASSDNTYLGKTGHSSPFVLPGPIDDVRIYNRVLSEEEVKFLYQAPYSMFTTHIPIPVAAASTNINSIANVLQANIKSMQGVAFGSVASVAGVSN